MKSRWHAYRNGEDATNARKRKWVVEIGDSFSLPHQNGNPTPPGCRFGFSGKDAPVVIRFGRNGFISFDPVHDQLANLFARAIDHRRVFVHRVSAAAVNTIIVCRETKLLRGREWLAVEPKVLDSLSDWF